MNDFIATLLRGAAPLVLLAATILLPAPAAAEPVEVTSVSIENAGTGVRPAGPVTFGIFFGRGDATGTVSTTGLASQVDVRRRWSDGSVKHAIVTSFIPELGIGESYTLGITSETEPVSSYGWIFASGDLAGPVGAAGAPTASLVESLPPVSVTFQIHGGPVVISTLEAAKATTPVPVPWLSGNLVGELDYVGVPVAQGGEPDPDLTVRYRVRYYPGADSVRLTVVVEHSKWTAPIAGIPYDVTVAVDGETVYEKARAGEWDNVHKTGYKTYLGHTKGSRWVKRFWIGRPLDDVHIRYDAHYLLNTGLLPRYDPDQTVPLEYTTQSWERYDESEHDILQPGRIQPAMPTTGLRADIGPLPMWTIRYLLTQDPRLREAVLGLGDLSGSIPVHQRDPDTDDIINVDTYPTYSLNQGQDKVNRPTRSIEDTPWLIFADKITYKNQGSHWKVDTAHQPSLAYVPYLITGDLYYLEEMVFWANWNIIHYNVKRRGENQGLVYNMGVRNQAWVLRNLADVVAVTPTFVPLQSYFQDKLNYNIQFFKDYVEGPEATSLGIYKYGTGSTGHKAWPKEWRKQYYSIAQEQLYYLVWSLGHIADLGYTEVDSFRDYLMDFVVGMVTHPDELNPHTGTIPRVFVAEAITKTDLRYAQSWAEVQQFTYYAPGFDPVPEPTATEGSQAESLRGALIEAKRAGRPNAAQAVQWVEAQLSDLQSRLEKSPRFALYAP